MIEWRSVPDTQPQNLNSTRELEQALKIFQDYTASWGYPMNQEAHAKGLEIAQSRIEALICRRDAEHKAALLEAVREDETELWTIAEKEARDDLRRTLAKAIDQIMDGGQ